MLIRQRGSESTARGIQLGLGSLGVVRTVYALIYLFIYLYLQQEQIQTVFVRLSTTTTTTTKFGSFFY